MKPARLGLLACAVLVALAAAPAARAQYTFSLIAESLYASLAPSINDSGTVAFAGPPSIGGTGGVYTASGGVFTPIALSPYFAISGPKINAAGTVAFYGSNGTGGPGTLFTGSGGAINTIAAYGPTFSGIGDFSINDTGTVAFSAGLVAGGGGIFTGAGGAATPLVQIGSTFTSATDPVINAAGTVLFRGKLSAGGTAGKVGLFTTANNAWSRAPFYYRSNGYEYLSTVTGGTNTVIDHGFGVFLPPSTYYDYYVSGAYSLNAAGQLAFQTNAMPAVAGQPAVGEGIYVGNGGPLTTVIRWGDQLFGSTVTDLSFGDTGLNNSGQVAFSYALANGSRGVAVASPVPEPFTALLLAAAGGTLLLRRGR